MTFFLWPTRQHGLRCMADGASHRRSPHSPAMSHLDHYACSHVCYSMRSTLHTQAVLYGGGACSGEYMGQAMRIHSEPDRGNISRALARLPDMPLLLTLELPLPGASDARMLPTISFGQWKIMWKNGTKPIFDRQWKLVYF